MNQWNPHFIPGLPKRVGRNRWHFNPPQLLILSYLALIVVGTCLLKTPWATPDPVNWLEAAFTATSAVTVTGLAVLDTGSEFTLFGQLVILTLIQFGGLGLMTFAILTALALGIKLGLRHQIVAREALNQTSFGTITTAVRSIAVFALVIETIGFVLLACFWVPEQGWGEGLYHALFYTVSAFNNAGFALSPESLSPYVSHGGIMLTVSALFIVGGLGYAVVMEIVEKRRFHTLSMYSKLILITTLILNLVAVAAFLLLEYGNPATLGKLQGFGDKLLAAWFQGTTPRTAGFNSLDVGSFTAATSIMFLLLMFVGGAPNSTASGIKISTFVVLLASTRSFLRGSLSVTLGKRFLPQDMVIKALAIVTIGMLIIFLAVMALSILEDAPFLDIAFETVSAFGTVGLSRGLTGELSAASQMIIMLVMLIGRVGPLTLGFLLTRPCKEHVRYARAELPLG
jgi:trk system potassium uptake protein TrkH